MMMKTQKQKKINLRIKNQMRIKILKITQKIKRKILNQKKN